MSGTLKQYDPKEVVMQWDGVDLNAGIAEGTFVTIARNTRTFTQNTGGDGGSTRVRMHDRSGVITLTYRAGSATNDALSARAQDEELEPPVNHVAPFLIKDFSGRTLHDGKQAWLDGPANDEKATEEGNIEWSFLVHDLKMFLGGSLDA